MGGTKALRSIGLAIGLGIAVLGLGAAGADETAIAQIKTAAGAAFVVRDGKRLPVTPGGELFEKDVLQTDSDGTIGVTFIDNTVLSLGPNSEAALAEYSFDSSNFKGAMLTDLHKGTLSMVSGDIARSSPDAMKVKTPTAILGVRGTSFAVEVGGR
jgi:hypothetical protein